MLTADFPSFKGDFEKSETYLGLSTPPGLVVTKIADKKLTIKWFGGKPLYLVPPNRTTLSLPGPTCINYPALAVQRIPRTCRSSGLSIRSHRIGRSPLAIWCLMAGYSVCQISIFLALAVSSKDATSADGPPESPRGGFQADLLALAAVALDRRRYARTQAFRRPVHVRRCSSKLPCSRRVAPAGRVPQHRDDLVVISSISQKSTFSTCCRTGDTAGLAHNDRHIVADRLGAASPKGSVSRWV